MHDNNDMDSKDSHAESTEDTGEGIGANMEESHTTEAEAEEKTNIQTDTSAKTKGSDTELHHQALDLIGTVLGDDYKGDKKKFFEDHPKLAEKANKSVRYKESYRKLTASAETDEEEDTADEEELLNRVSEKVYNKVTVKTMTESRKAQTNEYAVKEGINKDDVDNLYKAAEAINKATGTPFAKCLEGAKQALRGSLKPKSAVKMPSGEGMAKEGADKEAEISRLMSSHGVSRKQAETYIKNNGGYDGSLGTWVKN